MRPCTAFWMGLFLLFNSGRAVKAQSLTNYDISHYDTSDGLTNDWISALATDERGYLWIATQYGLNRYDGQGFSAFTYQANDTAGLGANWVRTMAYRPDGSLWMSTRGGGVTTLRTKTQTFSLPTEVPPLRYNIQAALCHHPELGTFASENNKLLWIQNAAYQEFKTDHSILKIVPFGSQDLLVGTQRTLVKWSATEGFSSLYRGATHAILPLSRDSVLAFVDFQLTLLLANETNEFTAQPLGISSTQHPQSFHVPFLYQTPDSTIWAKGEEGVWQLSNDLKTRQFIPTEDLLPYKATTLPSLHCMHLDAHGVHWLGTSQGLLQLRPKRPFQHPKLPTLPNVRAIARRGKHHFFANNKELLYWQEKAPTPTPILRAAIQTLFIAQNNKIYALGREGPDWLFAQVATNPVSVTKLKTTPSLPQTFSAWRRMTEDQRGRLWISDWNQLLCYQPTDGRWFHLPLQRNDGDSLAIKIVDLLVDRTDALWIATLSNGVIKVDQVSTITDGERPEFEQFAHRVNEAGSLSSNLVQSLYEDSSGRIWIGTDGGFNLFQPEQRNFRSWFRNDHFPDDKILDIVSDSAGLLWLNTISHGLIAYDPEKAQFTNYTQRDGLYSNDMLIGSAYCDETGRIWAGSSTGLNSFLPTAISRTRSTPQPLVCQHFTRQRVDTSFTNIFPQQGQTADAPLLLGPKDLSVQFGFAWLDFRFPQQHYRFKLAPLHQDWLPAQDDGNFQLTQLPPGVYTLYAEAISNNQEQRAVAQPIYLRVLPPWYRSPFAFCCYAILLIGAVLGLYRLQLNRKLVALERAQAEELVASKLQFFQQIAHEFRSPLTVLYGAVEYIKRQLGSPAKAPAIT
ncbi:MAG: two-component regulator propeller domain-containing protein, partial [Bacteroidota bacterium]